VGVVLLGGAGVVLVGTGACAAGVVLVGTGACAAGVVLVGTGACAAGVVLAGTGACAAGVVLVGAPPWAMGICFEGPWANAEADTPTLNATAPINRFQVIDVVSMGCRHGPTMGSGSRRSDSIPDGLL
jgi:hypothetical protein